MLVLFACTAPAPHVPVGHAGPRGPWSPLPDPVLEGQFPSYGTAGDPSVVADGDVLRMFYTDYAPELGGADTWSAVSTDGVQWALDARVLVGAEGRWDGAHETPSALDADTLYALGYPDAAAGFVSGADVGRWRRGADGWAADPAGPILTRTAGGLDADAITSPTVVADPAGGFVAVWTGWCFACDPVLSLLGARSADGVSWTRSPDPLVTDPGLDWADQGIAETQLFYDDGWWLLFSSVDGDLPHRIGLASAPAPEGPWTFDPEPLIVPEVLDERAGGGVLAPAFYRVDGDAFLAFSELDASGTGYRIGLAVPALTDRRAP